MKTSENKLGFTLSETLVATAVIAMMMITMIALVSYASEVWQRTHFTTTLAAESQMILDTIDRELSFATEVVSPGAIGTTGSVLKFKKFVFDFNRANSIEPRFIVRTSGSHVFSNLVEPLPDATWTVINHPENLSKHIARSQHNYDIGRHVDFFEVQRFSANRLDVRVGLKSKRTRDEPETKLVFSRSILIPAP